MGAYGEDSWRATPDFTVNYGVRYEISTPWWDATNKLETIVPGQQSASFPGAPLGWVMAGDPGVPRTLAHVKYDKFAPRLGFVWAPKAQNGFLGKLTGSSGRFSLRGSYGIFYTSFQDESGFVEVGDPPYGLFWATPVPVTLSTPYIQRSTQDVEPAKFPYAWPPFGVVSPSHPDNNIPWASLEPLSSDDAVNINNTVPYAEEYNLGIERQFGGATLLTLNYIGSQSRHLPNSVEANPGNIGLCLSLSQPIDVAPGTPTCGPHLESQQYTAATGTVYQGTRILDASNGQGLAWGSNPYLETTATGNYNAFQANLRYRTNRYGEILVGYTFSKSMDDASAMTDTTYVYNPHADYGLSKFDVPQYLVASYNILLPFGYWVSSHPAKALLGGWSITGVSEFAAGTPVTLIETDDQSLFGGDGRDLPNYTVGNIVADHNPRDRNPWFTTSLFSKESLGVYGDSKRRFFVGPGLDHTDLSLQRNFHIWETSNLNLRAEAFNIANHAEFSLPVGNINSGGFGKISSAAQSQRVLELAGKFTF